MYVITREEVVDFLTQYKAETNWCPSPKSSLEDLLMINEKSPYYEEKLNDNISRRHTLAQALNTLIHDDDIDWRFQGLPLTLSYQSEDEKLERHIKILIFKATNKLAEYITGINDSSVISEVAGTIARALLLIKKAEDKKRDAEHLSKSELAAEWTHNKELEFQMRFKLLEEAQDKTIEALQGIVKILEKHNK